MSSVEAKQRTRRPAARQRDVVLGCIEERLGSLESMVLHVLSHSTDTDSHEIVSLHAERLRGLLDELKRSVGKEESE